MDSQSNRVAGLEPRSAGQQPSTRTSPGASLSRCREARASRVVNQSPLGANDVDKFAFRRLPGKTAEGVARRPAAP